MVDPNEKIRLVELAKYNNSNEQIEHWIIKSRNRDTAHNG